MWLRDNATKRIARLIIILATCAIAVAYGSAFMPDGAPGWAPWLLALGIPGALGGIMVLGAARERGGVGRLAIPFAFVIVTLTVGFCLALGLPANEGPGSTLWLGLPARAALIIYGIGLMPVVVLPVAYALTFETQTLAAEDVEKVRQLGQLYAAAAATADRASAKSASGTNEVVSASGAGRS
ncbi:MAG TPA: hypothetical protein VES88_07200 [Gemmatimonadaceae bacterium]|nr:hypothetical protein [Gemmatimonadaceae bacterium]